jgi:hypothetical protein
MLLAWAIMQVTEMARGLFIVLLTSNILTEILMYFLKLLRAL